MLTSLFYSTYYRPYIVRDIDSPRPPRRPAAKQAAASANKPVLLNKTLNDDVIGYAKDVSISVLSVKDAARDAMYAIDRYDRIAVNVSEDAARENLSENVSDFARAYNKAASFLPGQAHSADLRAYYGQTAGRVFDNQRALRQIGLSVDGDAATVSYDPSVTQTAPDEALRAAIDEARPVFQALYDDAVGVLSKPLTDHMEFRSFRYYYNYRQGVTKVDTFSSIGTGTLVDIAL